MARCKSVDFNVENIIIGPNSRFKSRTATVFFVVSVVLILIATIATVIILKTKGTRVEDEPLTSLSNETTTDLGFELPSLPDPVIPTMKPLPLATTTVEATATKLPPKAPTEGVTKPTVAKSTKPPTKAAITTSTTSKATVPIANVSPAAPIVTSTEVTNSTSEETMAPTTSTSMEVTVVTSAPTADPDSLTALISQAHSESDELTVDLTSLNETIRDMEERFSSIRSKLISLKSILNKVKNIATN